MIKRPKRKVHYARKLMKGVKSNITVEEFDKIIPNDDMPPSQKMIKLYVLCYARYSTKTHNNNNSEKRVLIESIEHSRYDLVKYLVELRGSAILSASDTDSTIMIAAVKQNDVEIVRYLNTCLKLDFSRRDLGNKSLPIHIATERGMSYNLSPCPLSVHHQHRSFRLNWSV